MSADSTFRCPATIRGAPARRGTALLLAVIGVFIAALLATAALRLVSGEALMTENLQAGTQASYLADQALSQFYENYRPGDNLAQPTNIEIVTEDGDTDTTFVFDDYSSTDLKSADIITGNTLARIIPTKMLTSEAGDIYMIDATIMTEDPRRNRPVTVRSMRTFATIAGPVSVQAALSAPGGIYAFGDKDNPNRMILKGTKVDKCGIGTAVPGLATPTTAYNIYSKNLIKKLQIEPTKDFVGHDTTTDSYTELMDSLNVRWPALSSAATYANSPNHLSLTPSQFATLNWGSINKKGIWPTILVNGDVNVTNGYKGFGLLTVTGSLNVTTGVLKWDGLILVGKKLTVVNGPDEVDSKGKVKTGSGEHSHTHIKGAVAAGLNCSVAEAAAGQCRVEFGSPTDPTRQAEHLGVEYSGCNVRAAMAGITVLRPTAASRHFKLY